MRRIRPFCSVAALLLAASAAAGNLTSQELARLRTLSAPALSPDQTRLVVTVANDGAGESTKRLWQLPLSTDPAEAFALTTAASNAWSGRFSADGQWLYFLSDRSGNAQVWRAHRDGGDAEAVTELPIAVAAFDVAANGATVVVLVDTVKACGSDFSCSHDAMAAVPDSDAKIWTRESTPAITRRGLFALPLENGVATTDNAVELSAGIDGNVGHNASLLTANVLSISPDSRRVVFSATPISQDVARLADSSLYEVRLSGGRLRNLSADHDGSDVGPRHLPNGELVWLRADNTLGTYRHWVIHHRRSNGAIRIATPAWDRSPGEIVVTDDPNKLYAIAVDEGRRRLFEVELDNGIVFPRSAFGWVHTAIDAKSGPIIVMDSLHQPVELHQIAALDSALYRLSAFNSPAMADVAAGVYEVFRAGSDSTSLSTFLLRPPGHDGERAVPVLVLLRSTQHGTLGDHFRHDWVPQQLAAAGTAVLMIDYRGADGYGPTFAASFAADATTALDDISLALDTAFERYPWLDNARLCAAGAGLGGALAQVLAVRYPSRFRCLIGIDPIYDARSAALSLTVANDSLEPFAHLTTVGDGLDPAALTGALATPTLIIHRGKYATFQQAAALYGALRQREVDTVLVELPPSAAADEVFASNVNDWLQRFLKR
ncbi:MAG: prolyl oligopeptidase family serine peptidase [Pseudomonadota bacterium]